MKNKSLLILALIILILIGFSSLVLFFYNIYHNYHNDYGFLITSFISFFSTFIVFIFIRNFSEKTYKINFVVFFLIGWLVISFISSIPLLTADLGLTYNSIFFETISMLTTTGFQSSFNYDKADLSLHIWRSITQWIGGLYTLFIYIIILEKVLVKSKYKVNILDTGSVNIISIFQIYVFFTFFGFSILYLNDNTILNSICFSFATSSSGGMFLSNTHLLPLEMSTVTNKVILLFLMVINAFFLPFFLIIKNFSLRTFADNTKIRSFFITLCFVFVSASLFAIYKNINVLDSIFIATSMLTTNGIIPFSLTNENLRFTYYSFLMVLILFTFLGGMSGSVTGGIKNTNFVDILNTIKIEVNKLYQIHGVNKETTLNKENYYENISFIFAFLSLGIGIVFLSLILLSFIGINFENSLYLTTAALTNTGDGLLFLSGQAIPDSTFVYIILDVLMIIGRFETISIMLIFSSIFLKNNY